jgi:hypothetical protein
MVATPATPTTASKDALRRELRDARRVSVLAAKTAVITGLDAPHPWELFRP